MPSRRYTASDGYIATDLLRYACDHREAATTLLRIGPSYYDSAGYLAHLGLELLLKGVALHLAGGFTGTHDLDALLRELSRSGYCPLLSADDMSGLKTFNEFRKLRYPIPNAPLAIGTRHGEELAGLWECLARAVPSDLVAAYESMPGNQKGNRVFMVKEVDPASSIS